MRKAGKQTYRQTESTGRRQAEEERQEKQESQRGPTGTENELCLVGTIKGSTCRVADGGKAMGDHMIISTGDHVTVSTGDHVIVSTAEAGCYNFGN